MPLESELLRKSYFVNGLNLIKVCMLLLIVEIGNIEELNV